MSTLISKFRPLTDKELNKLRSQKRENIKIIELSYKIKPYIIIGILTFLSGVTLYFFSKSFNKIFLGEFVGQLIGFIFSVCIALLFYFPFEQIKSRKRLNNENTQIESLINKNEIEVYEIQTNQAIHFIQYDDEGELYLIQISENKLLYIWDDQTLIKKTKFPNTHFEIYKDIDLRWLLWNKVTYKGQRFTPKKVTANTKSKYFKAEGYPEDLTEIEGNIESFFEKVNQYKND